MTLCVTAWWKKFIESHSSGYVPSNKWVFKLDLNSLRLFPSAEQAAHSTALVLHTKMRVHRIAGADTPHLEHGLGYRGQGACWVVVLDQVSQVPRRLSMLTLVRRCQDLEIDALSD